MVEKNSEKKWMSILVVLMVIVLVVDLLSLNVLYKIANNSNLQGQLQESKNPNPSSGNPKSKNYDPCDECVFTFSSCLDGCDSEDTVCIYNCGESYDSCLYDNNC